jgi:hypothetical protein
MTMTAGNAIPGLRLKHKPRPAEEEEALFWKMILIRTSMGLYGPL